MQAEAQSFTQVCACTKPEGLRIQIVAVGDHQMRRLLPVSRFAFTSINVLLPLEHTKHAPPPQSPPCRRPPWAAKDALVISSRTEPPSRRRLASASSSATEEGQLPDADTRLFSEREAAKDGLGDAVPANTRTNFFASLLDN